jgi:hypothetical protein
MSPTGRLHLADSEVSLIAPSPGGWLIRFSAALVQQDVTGGEWGFAAGLALQLDSLAAPQVSGAPLGLLLEGHCVWQGQRHANVPLGARWQAEEAGGLRLTLVFANGSHWALQAHGLTLASAAGPLRESLAC